MAYRKSFVLILLFSFTAFFTVTSIIEVASGEHRAIAGRLIQSALFALPFSLWQWWAMRHDSTVTWNSGLRDACARRWRASRDRWKRNHL